MPCYHPLKAWTLGINEITGKRIMKVTDYNVNSISIHRATGAIACNDQVSSHLSDTWRELTEFTEVPCGQCIGCRLDRSRTWANRCLLELEYHDSAYFVTLTYNDVHLPLHWYADPDTGEATAQSASLSKRDFQLFMKRVRKTFLDDRIRFFACGEYGPSTFRPHYHAILFGLHLNDLVPFGSNRLGHQYFVSPSLQRCWSVLLSKQGYKSGQVSIDFNLDPNWDPIGFCLVANVTWETCAYTARYITKKLTGPEAQFYSDFNLDPPFSLMSRRPGIAYQWYVDHPDVMDYEYISVKTPQGGRKFRPPRYFDKLYDVDHPEELLALKATRKRMAEYAKRAKLSKTSLSYLELLQVEENNKLEAIKTLERRL